MVDCVGMQAIGHGENYTLQGTIREVSDDQVVIQDLSRGSEESFPVSRTRIITDYSTYSGILTESNKLIEKHERVLKELDKSQDSVIGQTRKLQASLQEVSSLKTEKESLESSLVWRNKEIKDYNEKIKTASKELSILRNDLLIANQSYHTLVDKVKQATTVEGEIDGIPTKQTFFARVRKFLFGG